jgi:hypothetical protein
MAKQGRLRRLSVWVKQRKITNGQTPAVGKTRDNPDHLLCIFFVPVDHLIFPLVSSLKRAPQTWKPTELYRKDTYALGIVGIAFLLADAADAIMNAQSA